MQSREPKGLAPTVEYMMVSAFRVGSFVLAAHMMILPAIGRAQTPDHVVIGVGAVHAPAYQGADDYRTLPIPVVDIVRGPFFANLRNGVGIHVVDTPTVTLGGSVAFLPGYRRRDAPDGIGRLSAGAGGRLFATVRAGGLVATLGGTQGFAGGTQGFIADANLAYPIVAGARLMLIPAVATSWADAKHNDRYFGVSARQARASGLPEFQVGQGFKDVTASLTASYRLNDRISLSASAGATALLGDAADSPLVFHKVQPRGLLSLSYRLGS